MDVTREQVDAMRWSVVRDFAPWALAALGDYEDAWEAFEPLSADATLFDAHKLALKLDKKAIEAENWRATEIFLQVRRVTSPIRSPGLQGDLADVSIVAAQMSVSAEMWLDALKDAGIDVPALKVGGLDKRLAEVLKADPSRLDMDQWHTCGTIHCRAGWYAVLAEAPKDELWDSAFWGLTAIAQEMVAEGRGDDDVPDFFAEDDEEVCKDIMRKAGEQ